MTTTAATPAPAPPEPTRHSVEVDGRRREYLLVRPSAPAPGAPLVLALHGSGQSAARVRSATGGALDALAAAGAAVAYLDAWRGGWNDDRTATDVPARRAGVDDVAYVAAVIEAAAATASIDPARVSALGFSAGGQMVLSLLHRAPGLLASAVVVAATQPVPENFRLTTSAEPVASPRPVVLVHGTADPIAPYGGGVVSLWGLRPRGAGLSAPATARYLAARNGVDAEATTVAVPHRGERDGTSVTTTRFSSPGHAGVVLHTVHGGGHTVPGPKRFPRLMGRTTRDVTAAGIVADLVGLTLPGTAGEPDGPDGPLDLPVTQVVVPAPGGPEVLVMRRAARPEPKPGQVLVAVQAAGVAFGDVQVRQGSLPGRFPLVPGYDVVGRVLAVGPGVDTLAVSQRVAGFVGTGGYATEVLVQVERCVAVPDHLHAAELAALVLNYTTAWQMLHRAARVEPGGRVLVMGAAGGVGTALSELAALEGTTVHGTASPARHAALSARGVHVLANREDLTDPVDATFDPVGGPSLALSRRVTARTGTVVAYGFSFAATRALSPRRTTVATASALARARLTPGPRVALFLIGTSIDKDPAAFRTDLAHLVHLLDSGQIHPQVQTLPFAQVAAAHRMLQERRVVGKLVLVTGAGDA